MGEYIIQNSTLTNLADAIRLKTKKNNNMTPIQMTEIIRSIPRSGKASQNIKFYDYDGTLLYAYAAEDMKKLTSLPELPIHEGLIAQEWNWTLEDIVEHNDICHIGVNYITDDGKTRIYLNFATDERAQDSSVFYLYQSKANGVVIDWGDGSPTETSNTIGYFSISHSYPSSGQYVLTLEPIGDCRINFGADNSNATLSSMMGLLGEVTNYYSINIVNKIELGKNIGQLNKGALSNLLSLKTISVPKDIVFSPYCFQYYRYLTAIIIPRVNIVLPEGCLYGAESLRTTCAPKHYVSVGATAFYLNAFMKNFIFSKDIETIGRQAFYGNYNQTKIVLTDKLKTLGESAFDQNRLIKDLIIPDTIISFNGSFGSCYSLENVKLSNNQINMPKFSDCRGLRRIELPESIVEIPASVFKGCYSLFKVNIPNKITIIPEGAFQTCDALATLKFPAGITSIGANAFSNTESMKLFDFSACTQIPTLTNVNAFSGSLKNGCKIKVPAALYEEWKTATNWATYAKYIEPAEEEAII